MPHRGVAKICGDKQSKEKQNKCFLNTMLLLTITKTKVYERKQTAILSKYFIRADELLSVVITIKVLLN